jgi:F-type H+-transporting ATPase subunit b
MHIDWWTLALQTVNVLVLIWILARFFFRPVADIVAKRQQEANKLLSDAAAARAAAADARAAADQARAEIGVKREQLIAEAREAARIEQKNLRAQTLQEITNLRTEAQGAIARDRAAAEQALIARASELAVEIAERLVGRLAPGTSFRTFLDRLCGGLRALSADARASLASATADQPLEVVSATPLSDEEIEHVGRALKEALGSEIAFKCRSNPHLIAGIELHSHNTIVRNSWRADLDRIRQELERGEQLGGS